MNWLTYQEGVKKTPAITRAVSLLEPYFEDEPSIISSGWRAPMDQLRLIIEKAERHKIDGDFGEFAHGAMKDPEVMALVEDKTLYWWQRTWSKLLSIGEIVNPPVPAVALFDYIRPGSTTNKKGQIIAISPHMHGLAFDIKGEKNLIEKAKRVMKASQEGDCFITSFLVEHVNNAVHVDVQQIG